MTDTMHKIVYDIFAKLFRESPSELEVVLDTNHGVNHFTLPVRESVVYGSGPSIHCARYRGWDV